MYPRFLCIFFLLLAEGVEVVVSRQLHLIRTTAVGGGGGGGWGWRSVGLCATTTEGKVQ